MHLVRGADLYFPQDRTDTDISAQGGNHQRVGFTGDDGHLSFGSWCPCYFTQLSPDITANSDPQLCQEIYMKTVKWYNI